MKWTHTYVLYYMIIYIYIYVTYYAYIYIYTLYVHTCAWCAYGMGEPFLIKKRYPLLPTHYCPPLWTTTHHCQPLLTTYIIHHGDNLTTHNHLFIIILFTTYCSWWYVPVSWVLDPPLGPSDLLIRTSTTWPCTGEWEGRRKDPCKIYVFFFLYGYILSLCRLLSIYLYIYIYTHVYMLEDEYDTQ